MTIARTIVHVQLIKHCLIKPYRQEYNHERDLDTATYEPNAPMQPFRVIIALGLVWDELLPGDSTREKPAHNQLDGATLSAPHELCTCFIEIF